MKLAVLLVLGIALVGCRGGRDDRGATSARAAIEGFDISDSGFESRALLSLAIVTEPEETREAALDLLESDDPAVRIAALYALSVTARPEDADALASGLEFADPGERVLAAAGLLAAADPRAIPSLIQGLGEDSALPFGFPPPRVWESARFALLQSTGQDLGLRAATTAAEVAATIPAWEAWWAEAEASFEVVSAPDPLGP